MQAITRNISWEFSDKDVPAWGGMRMFNEFYDHTGMRDYRYQAWVKNLRLPAPEVY